MQVQYRYVVHALEKSVKLIFAGEFGEKSFYKFLNQGFDLNVFFPFTADVTIE